MLATPSVVQGLMRRAFNGARELADVGFLEYTFDTFEDWFKTIPEPNYQVLDEPFDPLKLGFEHYRGKAYEKVEGAYVLTVPIGDGLVSRHVLVKILGSDEKWGLGIPESPSRDYYGKIPTQSFGRQLLENLGIKLNPESK